MLPTLLFVVTSGGSGGAQCHVLDLCASLRRFFGIFVMTGAGHFVPRELAKMGVPFLPNPHLVRAIAPFADLRAYETLRRHVSRIRPDITHAHTAKAGAICRALSADPRTPPTKIIYTPHNWSFNPANQTGNKVVNLQVEKLLARFTDRIICVSNAEYELARECDIPIDQTGVVIPNGVPIVEGSAEKVKHNKFRFIYIGRFDPPKNPQLVLEAFQLLPTEVIDECTLTLVGDGTQRRVLERLASKLPVELVGEVSRECTLNLLANSDCLIHASGYESFGLAVLEAMSLGVPVIAASKGGVQELLRDGEDGILLDPDDREGLTRAMISMFRQSDLRALYAASGQARSRCFTVQQMVDKTKAVYLEVLEGKGGHAHHFWRGRMSLLQKSPNG